MLIIAGAAWFAHAHGASFPLLSPAGPVGLAERSIMLFTFALSGIVVIPVFFLLFYFSYRYRAGHPKARAHHHPEWDHPTRFHEVFWWLIPSLIIAVLAVVAWRSSAFLNPYNPIGAAPALTVEVVALDWKWLFIYPDQGIASVNRLELPAGVPVHFLLTADAPMNSFWIPALGGQIMAMPGMTTQLNLEARATGTYDGASANISGEGFAGMAFAAVSVSPEEFDAWVKEAKSAHRPLDATAYRALAAPSSYVPPTLYSSVSSGLFPSIMMSYMEPSGATTSMMMRM